MVLGILFVISKMFMIATMEFIVGEEKGKDEIKREVGVRVGSFRRILFFRELKMKQWLSLDLLVLNH